MTSSVFSTPRGPFSLSYLAEITGANIWNNKGVDFEVSNLAILSEATSTSLCMLHQEKYLNVLKKSLAGACIIAPEYVEYAPETMCLLLHKNPYKAYALIAQVFYPDEKISEFIAPSAFIDPEAILGKDCLVEHGAYIGKKARIGNRCKIGVNTYIGDGVVIGDDCRIENNVSISHTVMGSKVLVYPGARIGQDGFGFASDSDGHYKIPHAGGVVIGNNVEIGSNTCIDRGSLTNTEIGDWCRLDNLVQVGHNVKIGKGSILCGNVALAGSCKIGEFVTLTGRVGVSGHVCIGDRATILADSLVIRNVAPGERLGGFPAVSARDWHKQTVFLKNSIKNKRKKGNHEG